MRMNKKTLNKFKEIDKFLKTTKPTLSLEDAFKQVESADIAVGTISFVPDPAYGIDGKVVKEAKEAKEVVIKFTSTDAKNTAKYAEAVEAIKNAKDAQKNGWISEAEMEELKQEINSAKKAAAKYDAAKYDAYDAYTEVNDGLMAYLEKQTNAANTTNTTNTTLNPPQDMVYLLFISDFVIPPDKIEDVRLDFHIRGKPNIPTDDPNSNVSTDCPKCKSKLTLRFKDLSSGSSVLSKSTKGPHLPVLFCLDCNTIWSKLFIKVDDSVAQTPEFYEANKNSWKINVKSYLQKFGFVPECSKKEVIEEF